MKNPSFLCICMTSGRFFCKAYEVIQQFDSHFKALHMSVRYSRPLPSTSNAANPYDDGNAGGNDGSEHCFRGHQEAKHSQGCQSGEASSGGGKAAVSPRLERSCGSSWYLY